MHEIGHRRAPGWKRCSPRRPGAGEALPSCWSFGKAKVEFKGEIDLVTDADRAAEQRHCRDDPATRFPDHGIFAEESGEHARREPGPLVGRPHRRHHQLRPRAAAFAVSIAVEVDGEMDGGDCLQPGLRVRSTPRIRGRGARLNGRPFRFRTREELERSHAGDGLSLYRADAPRRTTSTTSSTSPSGARRCAGLGSAALDLAYVARGALDGYWDTHLNPWDLAAGLALGRRGGGQGDRPQGRPLTYGAGQILATNGKIHEEMLGRAEAGKTGLEAVDVPRRGSVAAGRRAGACERATGTLGAGQSDRSRLVGGDGAQPHPGAALAVADLCPGDGVARAFGGGRGRLGGWQRGGSCTRPSGR